LKENNMATSPIVVAPPKPLEDPLAYLPRSVVQNYRKKQVIYTQDHPATGIYLVIEGKVKISRLAGDGYQVIVGIYRKDEFFGEGALLRLPHLAEQATALDDTRVMTWTTAEIEDIIAKRPRLGVALLQILAQRTLDFANRIESFSHDNIGQRLARALIVLSERLGSQQDDGSVHLFPLTHEFLSHYVGTSREVVTYQMNQFRRQECLRYSRKGIMFRPGALREWLRQNT
jgi:CRP-like cAMP-binding protein